MAGFGRLNIPDVSPEAEAELERLWESNGWMLHLSVADILYQLSLRKQQMPKPKLVWTNPDAIRR